MNYQTIRDFLLSEGNDSVHIRSMMIKLQNTIKEKVLDALLKKFLNNKSRVDRTDKREAHIIEKVFWSLYSYSGTNNFKNILDFDNISIPDNQLTDDYITILLKQIVTNFNSVLNKQLKDINNIKGSPTKQELKDIKDFYEEMKNIDLVEFENYCSNYEQKQKFNYYKSAIKSCSWRIYNTIQDKDPFYYRAEETKYSEERSLFVKKIQKSTIEKGIRNAAYTTSLNIDDFFSYSPSLMFDIPDRHLFFQTQYKIRKEIDKVIEQTPLLSDKTKSIAEKTLMTFLYDCFMRHMNIIIGEEKSQNPSIKQEVWDEIIKGISKSAENIQYLTFDPDMMHVSIEIPKKKTKTSTLER